MGNNVFNRREDRLHPTLDHLFDKGLISFGDDGKILISEKMTEADRQLLHIDASVTLRAVTDGMKNYLLYHRSEIFKD